MDLVFTYDVIPDEYIPPYDVLVGPILLTLAILTKYKHRLIMLVFGLPL